jgi:hypothetical protein
LGLVKLLYNKFGERLLSKNEAVDAKDIDYSDTDSASDIQRSNESKKPGGGRSTAQKTGGSKRKAVKRR